MAFADFSSLGLEMGRPAALPMGSLNRLKVLVQEGAVIRIIIWDAAGYSVHVAEYFCLWWMTIDHRWLALSTGILPNDEYEFWKRA